MIWGGEGIALAWFGLGNRACVTVPGWDGGERQGERHGIVWDITTDSTIAQVSCTGTCHSTGTLPPSRLLASLPGPGRNYLPAWCN